MEAIINAQRKRVSKHPLADRITDDEYFRNFYLPWIVMSVFYDHVDTVLLQAAQMRIEPLKKVCRQIKTYRADFEYMNKRCLGFNERQEANEHMEYFIDIFSKELDTEYQLIKWQVSHQRKMLASEWRIFISSVYMTMLIYEALRLFCVDVNSFLDNLKRKIENNNDDVHYHSIIPDMIPATYQLLKICLGDCDVLSQEDLKASKERILEMIQCVQFTDNIKYKRVNGKTLYQRYLEEKMGLPKAPNGTTKKLMKEFGITSEYKYHQLIREWEKTPLKS